MGTTGEHAQRVLPESVAGAALVLGAATLWATFGIFAKYLYEDGFSPFELASIRTAVAFAGILLIALVRPRSISIPLRAVPFFAAYGIIGFALFETVLLAAIERTTVSVAIALLYTAPVFVVLLSALLWRERIGLRRLIALVLAFTGVVLVTGAAGALLRGTAVLPSDALLLGLAAGFGYAMFTVFSKIATARYGPLRSLFWSFAFATLALAIIAPPWPPFVRAPGSVPLLIGLGVVPTILPYLLYLLALRRLEASTAAMHASVEPVAAALLAAVFLGERVSAVQVVGIVSVASAAILLASRQSRNGPERMTGAASGSA